MAKMGVVQFMERMEQARAAKTVYMWGCFGHPVAQTIINQKKAQYPTWYNASRVAYFEGLIGQGYFAFDCVNVIKGILWGWTGNSGSFTGGAAYGTQGVPDTNANGFFQLCTSRTSDFRNIIPGAIVWTDGHVGVYRGNREVIEVTFRWDDGVQVTGVRNLGDRRTKSREWKQWGLCPFIEYTLPVPVPEPEPPEVEDETPVPDNHVHPDNVIDYSMTWSKTFVRGKGFGPLGASALYTCGANELDTKGFPPLFDTAGNPIPDGAICEVRTSPPPQYGDIFRKAFGVWWRYGSDMDYEEFTGFPESPLSLELYPVQIVAFDWFTNEVKLFGLKEELYQRTIFAGGHFSLTGRSTDRFVGQWCRLQNGGWSTPNGASAPGWTVAEIYRCTRNVWKTKTGTEILFARNEG